MFKRILLGFNPTIQKSVFYRRYLPSSLPVFSDLFSTYAYRSD